MIRLSVFLIFAEVFLFFIIKIKDLFIVSNDARTLKKKIKT